MKAQEIINLFYIKRVLFGDTLWPGLVLWWLSLLVRFVKTKWIEVFEDLIGTKCMNEFLYHKFSDLKSILSMFIWNDSIHTGKNYREDSVSENLFENVFIL